jgi:hypothetical protein
MREFLYHSHGLWGWNCFSGAMGHGQAACRAMGFRSRERTDGNGARVTVVPLMDKLKIKNEKIKMAVDRLGDVPVVRFP